MLLSPYISPSPALFESLSLFFMSVSSLQFSSVAQSRPTLCDPMNCSTPGLPVHHQLIMSIKSVMPPSHLILCRPLLLLPPIPPSIRAFSNSQLFAWGVQSTGVSALASVLPMNTQDQSPSEWTGWISLQSKGLRLQHHSSKASILRHSAFFTVQLSYPYMITWKTIALTRRTFVGKLISLPFNMLSRLVIRSFQGVSIC